MFTLPPPLARPLHCESCWALGHHNGLSVGTDGGPFRRGHKKTAKVGGPRCLRAQAASMPYCQRRERTLEVEEGEKKTEKGFKILPNYNARKSVTWRVPMLW